MVELLVPYQLIRSHLERADYSETFVTIRIGKFYGCNIDLLNSNTVI